MTVPSVQIYHEGDNPEFGKDVVLLRLTFSNGYEAYIFGSRVEARYGDPANKKYPVWKMRVEDGKVWLTGPGSDSVMIRDPQGNELAHETVSGWPLRER